MQTKADESIVAKTRAAIIEFAPDEQIDELALQKTAYYLQFGYLGIEAAHTVDEIWPDDSVVHEIYDIIKFTSSFQAPCGHQAYKQVWQAAYRGADAKDTIACGVAFCNNYIY